MIRPSSENRSPGKAMLVQTLARTPARGAEMPDMVVQTIPPGIVNTRLPGVMCLGNLQMLRSSSSTKTPNLACCIKVAIEEVIGMMMVTRRCREPGT